MRKQNKDLSTIKKTVVWSSYRILNKTVFLNRVLQWHLLRVIIIQLIIYADFMLSKFLIS